MQVQQIQPLPPTRRPGRGFVISGIVLIVVAVLGVIVAVAALAGRVDIEDLTRDVAVNGVGEQDVPGSIGFRVIEDISSRQDSMTVGVALSGSSTSVTCEILTVAGEPVEVRRGSASDSFISPEIDADWVPAVIADDLEPGEYSATCEGSGEPSAVAQDRFAVGRVVTVSEMFDFVGPVFGIVGAVALGGLVGLVGLILLVVGLVAGNRARRGPGPPQQQAPWIQGPPNAGQPYPRPPNSGPPNSGPPNSGPPPWGGR